MRTSLAEQIAPPRSREENRVFRRESLIRSAIVTVARYDIAGATVERICHGAGASRGLIAHYFDSKEELLLAAAAETFDAQSMAVKQRIAEATALPAVERIKQMAKSSFEPPIYDLDKIAAWQAFTNASRSQASFNEVIRSVSEHLRELYEPVLAAAAAEHNRPIDTESAALGLIAVIDGLWTSLATGRDSLMPEDAIRITEHFIDGCLMNRALS
ncbi:MAG: TetR family transcriptional regulator C-terminal domain-containing protein [Pseudomonadota bacterium]